MSNSSGVLDLSIVSNRLNDQEKQLNVITIKQENTEKDVLALEKNDKELSMQIAQISKQQTDTDKNVAVHQLQIKNICAAIDKQTTNINKIMLLALTTLLGFFMWAVQQGMFK